MTNNVIADDECILHEVTKPYRYIGSEYLSYNKDFDKAEVKMVLAFPDKYEIGISNLGVRILYDLVNKNPDWMADRAYAPEPDFKPEILYGVESKRPLKDFDAIGFSLQYEMSYPTVLKLLEMSGIPYRNDMRGDSDPIIVAGGPCTFNPLPLADFIDVFLIGDGEDNIVETCEILEKTKGMPRTERIRALTEGWMTRGMDVWLFNNSNIDKTSQEQHTDNGHTSIPLYLHTSNNDLSPTLAQQIFNKWQNDILEGIIGLANIFDPDCVVLSGSMAEFVDIEYLEREANKEIVTTPFKVIKASAGNYSGMIGAALLALEKLFI